MAPDKKDVTVGLVLFGFGLSPLITAAIVRYLVENYGLMTIFLSSRMSISVILPILAVALKYQSKNEIEILIRRTLMRLILVRYL